MDDKELRSQLEGLFSDLEEPTRAEEGQPAFLEDTVEDITERKREKETSLGLERAVEQSIDGIAVADLDGNIQFVNPAWAQMHGYSAEELLGQNLSIFHTEEQLQEDVIPFNERVMEVGAHQGEVGHVRKDGTTFPTWMTTTLLKDEKGNPIGLVATARDITERKRLEQAIQESLERRARQVQTSTEVAQEIAAAPALEELYRRVVTLVKERFGYYHTQILRHDPEKDAMVVVEGYGQVGEKMKAAGHSLPYGKGVVGTAAATGEPVLASDVSQDPHWTPHPDLPDTRGELAVPIILRRPFDRAQDKAQNGELRDEVLGVLDVQSDTAGALGEEDQVVLLGLAGQIASAIESTQATFLLGERVKDLDCLNDIGRKIEETPPVSEFLQWVAERIPPAMQYPGACLAAIEFEGQVYGTPGAVNLPCQIVQGLRISGKLVGRVYISYTEERDFLDEESALLGDVVRRVSGYIENRRLVDNLEQMIEERTTELGKSQQMLQSVLDTIPIRVFWKDKDLSFLGCNQLFADDAGLDSPEEIIGKNDFDMIWADRAELYRSNDRQVIDSGMPKVNFEEPQTLPDGSQMWLRTSKIPLYDAKGNISGVLGTYEDITERKRLEQEIRESLERRGRQVQTSTEVAQEIAAAPALDELYRRVVTLVKERFGYYHTQILRHDPEQNAMVVAEGYGQAGEKMKAAGHSLPYGKGVVGTAAATGEPVLASDVSQDPHWTPHPDLPDTRGELAVPIILRRPFDRAQDKAQDGELRDEVLGVLDVQSDTAGALGEEDQVVLLGLAGQIASAIQSTRLFEQTQAALEEAEATHRRYLREQWTEFVPARVAPSYERTQPGVTPLGDAVLSEDFGELSRAIEQAMAQREVVVQSGTGDGAEEAPSTGSGQAALVVPISLRGAVIGALGLHETEGERRWTDDEVALVEAVADQMALAIENARLFEQTQSRAAREKLLADITARVRSSMDPQTILQTAVRELGAALGTDRAFVQLGKATPTQSVRPVARGQEASSEKQEP